MTTLSILEIVQQILFAMFLGGVIGIDRQKSANFFKVQKFAGVRTFPLIGLLGVLLAILEKISVIFFATILGGYILLIIASYVSHALQSKQNGGTSEIASIIVLIAGYFVGQNNWTFASVIIIVTAVLLFGREQIRNFAEAISKEEMHSIIQFVIIAFIVLPLLPNENFGPLESFNPYMIWTMIVLVSSISFLSYLAVKIVGTNKGISLSGFLGGFISSTAVTLAFSQRSKKYSKIVNPFVFGIVISSSAMFFRLLLAISVINSELASKVAIPLVSSGMTGVLIAGVLWYLQKVESSKGEKLLETENIDLGKPLDLVAGVKFGLLFFGVIWLSKYMNLTFGDSGVYITSIVSAILDTDAITISLSNLAKSFNLSVEVAAIGIALAAFTNTLMKSVYTLLLASRAVAIRTSIAMVIVVAVGAFSLIFL